MKNEKSWKQHKHEQRQKEESRAAKAKKNGNFVKKQFGEVRYA